MDVRKPTVEIEVDADDIKHLMSNGTTNISEPESEVHVTIRCRDSLTFDVITPTSEEREP
jgi:hypothetical protein